MMNDYELIKCPFCGSNGELCDTEVWEDDDYSFEMYYVRCENYDCKARTEFCYMKNDAIDEWNNNKIEEYD